MSRSPAAYPAPGDTPPVRPEGEPPSLPIGTVLLHIGPPKTGTTALQGAFWNARAALAAQGVRYAGGVRVPVMAAMAALQQTPRGRATPPPIRLWTAIVREVRAARDARSVISCETFAQADDAAAARVVADLGAHRTHVLVTLRPLDRLLASQWQQSAQHGLALSFEDWLHAIFDRPTAWPGKAFWHVRGDRLVRRWAQAAGAANVTVMVVDDRDRDRHFRDLEALLALPAKALVPDVDRANRSLTADEVAVLQAVRKGFDAHGLSVDDYVGLISTRATLHVKRRTPLPVERRIDVPDWAVDRAAAMSREIVAAIAASGVRVLGDLDILAPSVTPAASAAPGDQAVPMVPLDVAAQVAMGIVLASGSAGGSSAVGDPWARRTLATELPLVRLVALLVLGVTARVRRRFSRPRGQSGS